MSRNSPISAWGVLPERADDCLRGGRCDRRAGAGRSGCDRSARKFCCWHAGARQCEERRAADYCRRANAGLYYARDEFIEALRLLMNDHACARAWRERPSVHPAQSPMGCSLGSIRASDDARPKAVSSETEADVPYSEDLQNPSDAKAWVEAADRKRPSAFIRRAIVNQLRLLAPGSRVLELGSARGCWPSRCC